LFGFQKLVHFVLTVWFFVWCLVFSVWFRLVGLQEPVAEVLEATDWDGIGFAWFDSAYFGFAQHNAPQVAQPFFYPLRTRRARSCFGWMMKLVLG